MVLLPAAMAARGDAIARGWAASLTMGAGRFCTNPGIAVVLADQAQALADATVAALREVGAQVMLTEGIAAAYAEGAARVASAPGVRALLTSVCGRRQAALRLCQVRSDDWLADHGLAEEVFGPLGLIVTVAGEDQMLAIAHSLKRQLTATLHMGAGDTGLARRLLPILERKAGRVLANAYPTGVEVCDAMVHGGPSPASTNFGATSVGTLSIRRFLRAVSYQNLPEEILHEDLA